MIRKSLSLLAVLFAAVLVCCSQAKSQAQGNLVANTVYGIDGDFGTATNGVYVSGEGFFTGGAADGTLLVSGIKVVTVNGKTTTTLFDFGSDSAVSLTFNPISGKVVEWFTGGYSTYDADGNYLDTVELFAKLTISYVNGTTAVAVTIDGDIDIPGIGEQPKDNDPWYTSGGMLSQVDGTAVVAFQ